MCAACLIWALPSLDVVASGAGGYELVFSTYVGGKSWEHARDVCCDKDGNVYMVGGTASRDFPTTPGAYDRTFDAGGKQIGGAGLCDAFVMKFSPEGKLIWSTLLGGPNCDRAYGVEVDREGCVYVAGRAGPGFPVSEGAFQTEYGGSNYNGFYGSQNGFVAKLSPTGALLRSTLIGGKDKDGANGPGWPVRNAFQAKFAGTNDRRWGNGDCILARFRRSTRAKQGAPADADKPRR